MNRVRRTSSIKTCMAAIAAVAFVAGNALELSTNTARATAVLALSTPKSASATRSAQQCADGHSISAKLEAADFTLIQRFIVCLGKQWTLTPDHLPVGGEGGFGSLGGDPGVVSVLNSFARDPKSDNTAHFIVSRLDAAKDTELSAPLEDVCFGYALGDTTPPSPSLATLAGWIDNAHSDLVKAIGVEANYLGSTAIVEHGAWFHDGSTKNVRFAVVFAGGSPTGHADCSR